MTLRAGRTTTCLPTYLARGRQKKWDIQTNLERSTADQSAKFDIRLDIYLRSRKTFCLNLYSACSGCGGHGGGREKR